MANTIPTKLTAPCGMNCRLCRAFTREKNTCPGCLVDDSEKSRYCVTCRIKNCDNFASGKNKFYFNCKRFPCARLKQLDKRYRTKYSMSMKENLETLSDSGIRHYVRNEKQKWTCPECSNLICVHKPQCLSCGYEWQCECSFFTR